MLLSDLVGECNESIVGHHASGHFDREEATARLVANGMSPDYAATWLDQPVDPALFDRYKTYPTDI